jgi:hypothetical protein
MPSNASDAAYITSKGKNGGFHEWMKTIQTVARIPPKIIDALFRQRPQRTGRISVIHSRKA